MYGGMWMYTKASCDLAKVAQAYEMDIKMFYLFNESLITRARNYCVDEFLRSDYTHMCFIDSDIGFDPNDVLTLAILAEEGKRDIVWSISKENYSLEKIKKAVEMGFEVKILMNLKTLVVIMYLIQHMGVEMRLDEPIEVLEGGTAL